MCHITEVVTVGNNLQWFAGKLVEKGFIHQQATFEILGKHDITPEERVGRLLESVFAVIRNTDRKKHWFDEFNAIFSKESEYVQLVDRLRNSYGEGSIYFHTSMLC